MDLFRAAGDRHGVLLNLYTFVHGERGLFRLYPADQLISSGCVGSEEILRPRCSDQDPHQLSGENHQCGDFWPESAGGQDRGRFGPGAFGLSAGGLQREAAAVCGMVRHSHGGGIQLK